MYYRQQEQTVLLPFTYVAQALLLSSLPKAAAIVATGEMGSETTNAIAGPSNPRNSPRLPSPATPYLFLPPPGLHSFDWNLSALSELIYCFEPAAPPQAYRAHLSSTQDLLARFDLLPAYDKYVRPFTTSTETGLDQMGSPPSTKLNGNGAMDKGKGREVVDTPNTPGLPDGGDGDDDEGMGGKGDKKKKNNYKYLLKGIPGESTPAGSVFALAPNPGCSLNSIFHPRQTLV